MRGEEISRFTSTSSSSSSLSRFKPLPDRFYITIVRLLLSNTHLRRASSFKNVLNLRTFSKLAAEAYSTSKLPSLNDYDTNRYSGIIESVPILSQRKLQFY